MNTASSSLTPIRVVVASPNDVLDERDAVTETAERINRNYLVEQGYILRVFRWETDSYPGFHAQGPQGLINDIANVQDCDILIGIFWKRFGTPIAESGETGTEHEIREAYDAWKNSGNKKPQIMLYFNEKEVSLTGVKEAEQYLKVKQFKQDLPKEAFTRNYAGLDSFKTNLYDHLSMVIKKLHVLQQKKVTGPTPPPLSVQTDKLQFIGEIGVLVGRKEYLEKKIKEKIKNPGFRVSIVGPGGSGKSQLAFKALRQYFEKDKIIDLIVPVYLSPYSYIEQKPDGNKTVSTNITFRKFLNDIGFYLIKNKILRLNEQQFEEFNIDRCKSAISDTFSGKVHPVLYLDNFETVSMSESEKKHLNQETLQEIDSILKFLNWGLPNNTSILVTSRNVMNFLKGEEKIDLLGLEMKEGIELFTENASVYRNHLENKSDHELQKLLTTIVRKTGGHPFSIEILAKSYRGGGKEELDEISKTLGKDRKNAYQPEERLTSLHTCFSYSIELLDSELKNLFPLITIFLSPFPSGAIQTVFGVSNAEVELYNKSLLSKLDSDQYGILDTDFWLYTLHPALRNYLEDRYADDILRAQVDSYIVANFCNYYNSLVVETYKAWGTPNHQSFMRRFDLMSISEGKNDFDRAIEFAESFGGYDKEQEKNGKLNGAIIAVCLGIIYSNSGLYENALTYHQKALEIDEELKDRKRIVADYTNIGLAYSNKGQYDNALTYHMKALAIDEKLNDKVGMAGDYNNVGLAYRNKGQLDDALTYHQKALAIDEKLNDKVSMAGDYNNVGLAYREKGQLDDALTYHQKALAIDEEFKDRVEMSKDYNNIGMVYYRKLQFDDALTYHQKALAIDENLNDRVAMARDYTNIGLVYSDNDEPDNALTYHQKALAIDEKLNNIVGMGQDYTNIGLVYYKKGQHDNALSYNQKALVIDQELNDRVAMAIDYRNIGLVYREKGQYDDALTYYQKSLAIREELKDRVEITRDYCNIGFAYLDKGIMNKAKEAASNASNVIREFEKETGVIHPLKSLFEELLYSINKSSTE